MNNRTLRSLPLIVLGIWFAYRQHKSSQSDFFIDGFVFLAIGLLGLFFFIRAIFRDTKEYKVTKSVVDYSPTIIGLCFIMLITGIYYYQEQRDNAPTLLKAFYDGGYNGFSIDFKANGEYIMANGSGLGQSYFYGTYVIADSVITLDKKDIDNVIESDILLISNSEYYLQDGGGRKPSSKRSSYLTQLDKDGNEIDAEFRLIIIQDNRK